MVRKRYNDEQIAFALRQAEIGTSVTEVIRKMGICEQTSGTGVPDSACLRAKATCSAEYLDRFMR